MKKIFLLTLVLIAGILLIASCSKKSDAPVAVKDAQKKSVLSDEIIHTIEKIPSIYEYVQFIKQLNIPEITDLTPLEKFETSTSREKTIMRFGMLSVDAAYLVIAAGKVQIPEYQRLYEKYVSELNLQPIIKELNEQYLPEMEGKELNLELAENLLDKWNTSNPVIDKFHEDRKVFVDKAREFDEEFLVYYALGSFIQMQYITNRLIRNDTTGQTLEKIRHLLKNHEMAGLLFTEMLCSFEEMQYSNYAKRMLPALELYKKGAMLNVPLTEEERALAIETFKSVREDILN